MSEKELMLDPVHECMSRDEMAVLQGKKLVRTVQRCYDNVPFYHNKMKDMGLEPGDIRGIEDIVKLPFTTRKICEIIIRSDSGQYHSPRL